MHKAAWTLLCAALLRWYFQNRSNFQGTGLLRNNRKLVDQLVNRRASDHKDTWRPSSSAPLGPAMGDAISHQRAVAVVQAELYFFPNVEALTSKISAYDFIRK